MVQTKLVQMALENYDRTLDKYEDIFNKVVNTQFKNTKVDTERSLIKTVDKQGNTIFTAKYEYLGLYYKPYSSWIWAWAIPGIPKNASYISRDMLEYGLNIDFEESSINRFLKAELITSRFQITNEIQLETHIALASYLTKKPIVYPYKVSLGEDDSNYVIYYMYLYDMEVGDKYLVG